MATFEVVSLYWMADYFSELLLRLTLFLVSWTWQMMGWGGGAECAEGLGGESVTSRNCIKVGQTVCKRTSAKKEEEENCMWKELWTGDSRKLAQCSGQADSQLSESFSLRLPSGTHIRNPNSGLEKSTVFPDSDFFFIFFFFFSSISHLWVSVCLRVFLTGRPMGLQSCKPRNSCLQSKEACGPAGGCCSCVCDDWRYCCDRCCDICCQVCVNVCSGLCSGDCSYTFCTLCLILAQNCVSLFTSQPTRTSQRKSCWSQYRPLYWLPVLAKPYLVWLFSICFSGNDGPCLVNMWPNPKDASGFDARSHIR